MCHERKPKCNNGFDNDLNKEIGNTWSSAVKRGIGIDFLFLKKGGKSTLYKLLLELLLHDCVSLINKYF